MARNTEKGAKCETNTIRHGIWRETVKNYKYEKQFRTWIVARKKQKLENETQTLYEVEYGERH